MVSGLLSAKTVAHLSIAVETASFEHAIAVCNETPVFNTSTTALIVRTVRIISSLISSATIARPEQAVFTLQPPTGWDLQEHAFDSQGNALPEAPANFRRLGEVKAGEVGALHTLILRFADTITLTHIKSTPDFRIEQGGSCMEGNAYAANTTCTLLLRFTPLGPGQRLGRLLITHSGSGALAASTPAHSGSAAPAASTAFGLGGLGY